MVNVFNNFILDVEINPDFNQVFWSIVIFLVVMVVVYVVSTFTQELKYVNSGIVLVLLGVLLFFCFRIYGNISSYQYFKYIAIRFTLLAAICGFLRPEVKQFVGFIKNEGFFQTGYSAVYEITRPTNIALYIAAVLGTTITFYLLGDLVFPLLAYGYAFCTFRYLGYVAIVLTASEVSVIITKIIYDVRHG